jgi:HEAT repeat protein
MKHVLMGLILVVAGYFMFLKFKPKSASPASQAAQEAALPPPPIVVEPVPIISPEEQAKIIRAANDQDPNVRWESMLLLDKMKSPEAMPLFIEKVEKDPEAGVRIKILNMLGTRRGPDVVAACVNALKDMEPEVRIAALDALEQIGDYSTSSAISDMLKDGENTVRARALKALNTLQDRKAAEIAAEQKRQEEIRRRAMEEAAAKKGK